MKEWINIILLLIILIGTPIMIAIANANYKPEKEPTIDE